MQRKYVILGAVAALLLATITGLGGYWMNRPVVQPPPSAPACTLSATPTRVQAGRPVQLAWTLKNVATATIDQGIGPVFAVENGVVAVEKLGREVKPTATTTFTMTVKNRAGEASCATTVTVAARQAAALPPPAPPPAATSSAPATQPATSSAPARATGVGLEADRYVGVLWIKETPRTRQMMEGLTGAQRFSQLYSAIRPGAPASDRIEGVGPGRNGQVPMTIRSGATVHWSGVGTIEGGIARVKVPAGTQIPVTASLCAVFPTALGYHQVAPRADLVKSGEEGRLACLDGTIHNFFVNLGRGKTPEDGAAVLGFERS